MSADEVLQAIIVINAAMAMMLMLISLLTPNPYSGLRHWALGLGLSLVTPTIMLMVLS